MREERVELTKTDIRLALSSRGYRPLSYDDEVYLFEKFEKYYSLLFNSKANQYTITLYKEKNGEKETLKQISFNLEKDKNLTRAHLVDALNSIEAE